MKQFYREKISLHEKNERERDKDREGGRGRERERDRGKGERGGRREGELSETKSRLDENLPGKETHLFLILLERNGDSFK